MTDSQQTAGAHQEALSEVPQELHPFVQKLLDNLKYIVAGIVAIIVLVGAYAGYSYIQDQKRAESVNELGKIILQTKGDVRIKALQGYLDKAPSSMKTQVLLELASAYTQNNEYEKAAEVWARIEDFRDGRMDIIAKMGRANALAAEGRHDVAENMLEEIRVDMPPAYEKPIALMIAKQAEASGNVEKAKELYTKLAEQSTGEDQGFFTYKAFKLSGGVPANAQQQSTGAITVPQDTAPDAPVTPEGKE